MATLLDHTSPERGWPPFLDWLRRHGLDPNDVLTVTVNEVSVVATVLVRDADGHPIVDNDELRTHTKIVPLLSDPPRRVPESAG